MRRLVSATLAEAAGDRAERLFVYLILHLLDSCTLRLMGKNYYMFGIYVRDYLFKKKCKCLYNQVCAFFEGKFQIKYVKQI